MTRIRPTIGAAAVATTLVFTVLCAVPAAASAKMVAITDPHVYRSEHNWAVLKGTGMASVNSGAYIKVNFTGQTSAPVLLVRPLAAGSPKHYMNIIYSLDDAEFAELPVFENTTQLVLAPPGGSPLAANTSHDLVFMVYNSLQSAHRWTGATGPGGAALVLTDLQLDAAAEVLPYGRLAPKRCVFFGDSITEGVAAQCTAAPTCTARGDLCNNAASKTWGRTVAAALGCEYSQIGFGGLGWTVPGGGAVVPFFTPGQPAQTSWNQHFAGQPRAFGPGIDYLFVLHATNDGLRHGDVKAVTASVHGWLAAVRKAVGPTTQVFLTIPFGGFGAGLAPVGALPAGFAAYKKDTPGDAATHLIDLGPSAARGLTHFPAPTAEGCHGIHPRGGTTTVARHGELGAMLAVQAVQAVAEQSRAM